MDIPTLSPTSLGKQSHGKLVGYARMAHITDHVTDEIDKDDVSEEQNDVLDMRDGLIRPPGGQNVIVEYNPGTELHYGNRIPVIPSAVDVPVSVGPGTHIMYSSRSFHDHSGPIDCSIMSQHYIDEPAGQPMEDDLPEDLSHEAFLRSAAVQSSLHDTDAPDHDHDIHDHMTLRTGSGLSSSEVTHYVSDQSFFQESEETTRECVAVSHSVVQVPDGSTELAESKTPADNSIEVLPGDQQHIFADNTRYEQSGNGYGSLEHVETAVMSEETSDIQQEACINPGQISTTTFQEGLAEAVHVQEQPEIMFPGDTDMVVDNEEIVESSFDEDTFNKDEDVVDLRTVCLAEPNTDQLQQFVEDEAANCSSSVNQDSNLGVMSQECTSSVVLDSNSNHGTVFQDSSFASKDMCDSKEDVELRVINTSQSQNDSCGTENRPNFQRDSVKEEEESPLPSLIAGTHHSNRSVIPECHKVSNRKPKRRKKKTIPKHSKVETKLEIPQTSRTDSVSESSVFVCRRQTRQRKHLCSQCGDHFESETSLSEHQRSHKSEKPFICHECGDSFENKSKYRQHSVSHERLRPFLGNMQTEIYSRLRDLKARTLAQKDTKNSKSTDTKSNKKAAKASSASKSEASNKVVVPAERMTYPCGVCGKTFNRKSNLLLHEVTHSGDAKPFVCKACGESFHRKALLLTHVQIHKTDAPAPLAKLPVASPKIPVTEALPQPEEVEEIDDDTEDSDSEVLPKHGSESHKHSKDKKGSKEKEKKECDQCGAKFTRTYYLNIHKRTHTGEKPYACRFCGEEFHRADRKREHELHHTGEKPYMCKLCGFNTRTHSQLRVHMKIHKDDKPYQCDLCGVTFKHKSSLAQHNRLHSGEKPYKCQYCDQSFRQLGHLQEHARLHTGEMPFLCQVCGKEFRHKASMKRHVMIHTGEKPHGCDVCGKRFYVADKLKEHKKTHDKDKKLNRKPRRRKLMFGNGSTRNDITAYSKTPTMVPVERFGTMDMYQNEVGKQDAMYQSEMAKQEAQHSVGNSVTQNGPCVPDPVCIVPQVMNATSAEALHRHVDSGAFLPGPENKGVEGTALPGGRMPPVSDSHGMFDNIMLSWIHHLQNGSTEYSSQGSRPFASSEDILSSIDKQTLWNPQTTTADPSTYSYAGYSHMHATQHCGYGNYRDQYTQRDGIAGAQSWNMWENTASTTLPSSTSQYEDKQYPKGQDSLASGQENVQDSGAIAAEDGSTVAVTHSLAHQYQVMSAPATPSGHSTPGPTSMLHGNDLNQDHGVSSQENTPLHSHAQSQDLGHDINAEGCSDEPQNHIQHSQSHAHEPQSHTENPQTHINDSQSHISHVTMDSQNSPTNSTDPQSHSHEPQSHGNEVFAHKDNVHEAHSQGNEPDNQMSDQHSNSNESHYHAHDPQSHGNELVSDHADHRREPQHHVPDPHSHHGHGSELLNYVSVPKSQGQEPFHHFLHSQGQGNEPLHQSHDPMDHRTDLPHDVHHSRINDSEHVHNSIDPRCLDEVHEAENNGCEPGHHVHDQQRQSDNLQHHVHDSHGQTYEQIHSIHDPQGHDKELPHHAHEPHSNSNEAVHHLHNQPSHHYCNDEPQSYVSDPQSHGHHEAQQHFHDANNHSNEHSHQFHDSQPHGSELEHHVHEAQSHVRGSPHTFHVLQRHSNEPPHRFHEPQDHEDHQPSPVPILDHHDHILDQQAYRHEHDCHNDITLTGETHNDAVSHNQMHLHERHLVHHSQMESQYNHEQTYEYLHSPHMTLLDHATPMPAHSSPASQYYPTLSSALQEPVSQIQSGQQVQDLVSQPQPTTSNTSLSFTSLSKPATPTSIEMVSNADHLRQRMELLGSNRTGTPEPRLYSADNNSSNGSRNGKAVTKEDRVKSLHSRLQEQLTKLKTEPEKKSWERTAPLKKLIARKESELARGRQQAAEQARLQEQSRMLETSAPTDVNVSVQSEHLGNIESVQDSLQGDFDDSDSDSLGVAIPNADDIVSDISDVEPVDIVSEQIEASLKDQAMSWNEPVQLPKKKKVCVKRKSSPKQLGKGDGRAGSMKSSPRAKGEKAEHPCQYCDAVFTSSYYRRVHERIHTGDKPFCCQFCPEKFYAKDRLKEHERLHTGEKPFICSLCGAASRTHSAHRVHMKVHSDDKPFQCDTCGVCFKHKTSLTQHERLHSGDKPFECEWCHQHFRQQGHLKEHVRVHTGETPYLCQVCGKSFRHKASMTRHAMIHTGERPFGCDECGKRFIVSDKLRDHKKIHEKAKARSKANEAAFEAATTMTSMSTMPFVNTEMFGKTTQHPAPKLEEIA